MAGLKLKSRLHRQFPRAKRMTFGISYSAHSCINQLVEKLFKTKIKTIVISKPISIDININELTSITTTYPTIDMQLVVG